jgi:hypothetical protein
MCTTISIHVLVTFHDALGMLAGNGFLVQRMENGDPMEFRMA